MSEEDTQAVQTPAPAKVLTPDEELKAKIDALEAKKTELIEHIKQTYRRIRYKKYEQKALGPFLEQTKDVQVIPFRKQKRALEFKISTAAYTPKMERELLKQVRQIEEQLEKVKEVEKARRKARYVEQDIIDAEKEIVSIETELKVIRDELKKLYDGMKSQRSAQRKQAQAEARAEEDFVALGDVALIEKN